MIRFNSSINISNNSIIQDFKKHLDIEFNKRILFSAPFGAGKSTFINDFHEQHKAEYSIIRLYPINYSVSSNEDIFELIKFDILYELMAHYQEEIVLTKEDFDFWLRISTFLRNKANLMPLFLHIISLHETIGKPVSKFIEILEPLIKDFEVYSDTIKVDEIEEVFSFFKTFEAKKGSPYEMDATSQLIFDLLYRLKINKNIKGENKDKTSKTVLVIDDLDRLDPGHIFRLFNLFSAHTHSITGENKFGFDKVIFVCDLENIRKIYAYKYGKEVDFSGYIDKFYSIKPFDFNHREHLTNLIWDIVKNYNIINVDKNFIEGSYFKDLLVGSIKILIGRQLINLRSLLQNINNTIDGSSNKDTLFGGSVIPGVVLFKVLKSILGGESILEDKFVSFNRDYTYQEKIYNHNYFFDYNLTESEYKAIIETCFALIIKKSFLNTNLVDVKQEEFLDAYGVTIMYTSNRENYIKYITIDEVYKGLVSNHDIMNNHYTERVILNVDKLMFDSFKVLKTSRNL